MPVYVYRFVDSGETFEVQQSFTDAPLTEAVHPGSGELLPVRKVFTPVGVTFKGAGFYKTDSRGKKGSASSGSAAASGSGNGSSGSDGSASSGSDAASAASTSGSSSPSTPASGGDSSSSGGHSHGPHTHTH